MHAIIILSHTFLSSFSLPAERNAAVEEAIIEAKSHSKEREEMRKAKAQAVSAGPVRISSKHFKQASKEALRQGEARERFEDMVHRAERKLAEVQRKSHTGVLSAEARAEELATELFHKPGSMLKKEEIARMKTESGCTGRKKPMCFTPTFQRFRTIDSTCNNLMNPLLGATDTPLVRLIPSQYEDGISSLRGGLQNRKGEFFKAGPFSQPNPSARLVSQTVIRNVNEDEALTHIAMQWGQFLDHDTSLTPEQEDKCNRRVEECEFTNICEPIRVPDRDPIFGVGTDNNGQCMAFSRSMAACVDEDEPLVNGIFRPREQINVLTSFIDGSMVYGSDEELARKLRSFEGGLLREGENFPGNKPSLPRVSEEENRREQREGQEPREEQEEEEEEEEPPRFVGCPNYGKLGCFLAGDFRVNEHLALTVMHTIWFREHNRIARELAVINPHWSDERLYQEARRIVGALIQKITYVDYLHPILGDDVYDMVLDKMSNYDPRINPGINNAFSTAAYRYGHTLIRSSFKRLGSNYLPIGAGPLDLLTAFFDPDQFKESFGTDPILRGLVTENSSRVDEFMNSVLTNHLFGNNLDLASLNIQRGRDHGLPPYITWQRYCHTVFPNLTLPSFDNTLTLVRFLEIYGSLDTVDLWIGGLAEERLPGSLLGPTFACLFGITFANLRDGDRLFYTNPGVFESKQLEQIQQDTLSRVICDNSDNIHDIQENAFLTGKPRVPCSTLPRIDLSLWKEDLCYFRIKTPVPIRSYSRSSSTDTFSAFQQGFNDRFGLCMPMVCPKNGGSVELIVYIYDCEAHGSTGKLLISVKVPSNNIHDTDGYHATVPDSYFSTRFIKTGLYRNLGDCQSFSLRAFSTFGTEIASEEWWWKDTLKQTCSENDIESPQVDEEVPEAIRNILTEVSPSTPTNTAESESESEFETESETEFETEFETESEIESDAELMSDLEEALKYLNE